MKYGKDNNKHTTQTTKHIYTTYRKISYKVIKSSKAFFRISKASFKNLAILYNKVFLSEANKALNLFKQEDQEGPGTLTWSRSRSSWENIILYGYLESLCTSVISINCVNKGIIKHIFSKITCF